MKKPVVALFGLVFALAACETTPPPPSPAEANLMAHCEAGAADACFAIAQLDAVKKQQQLQASAALLGYSALMQSGY